MSPRSDRRRIVPPSERKNKKEKKEKRKKKKEKEKENSVFRKPEIGKNKISA